MRNRFIAGPVVWATLLWMFAMTPCNAQVPESAKQGEPLPDFVQMVANADVVMVAKVDQVTRIGDLKVAEATIIDAIRGMGVGLKVAYLAQGSSLTDDSFAVQGETVLLFLMRYPAGYGSDHDFFMAHPRFLAEQSHALGTKPLYRIASAGFGRMAVFRAESRNVIFEPVNLPPSVPVFPFPQAYGTAGHIVRIADIEKLVKQIGHSAPSKPLPDPHGGNNYVRNRVGQIQRL